jgi:hypothetical protein
MIASVAKTVMPMMIAWFSYARSAPGRAELTYETPQKAQWGAGCADAPLGVSVLAIATYWTAIAARSTSYTGWAKKLRVRFENSRRELSLMNVANGAAFRARSMSRFPKAR